jgi:putative PIN family toxin of toxin-antitoxin system
MGKVPKVAIDTNIFVSAFGWKGSPRKVLKLVEDGRVKNFTCPAIIEEVKRVVSYRRLAFPVDLQAEVIEFIYFYSEIVTPKEKLEVIKEDLDDNKFLECAVESEAKYIISGNKHLLKLRTFRENRSSNRK